MQTSRLAAGSAGDTELEGDAEAGRSRRCRRLLWVLLLAFVVVQAIWVRPDRIGASWRECDTQAIARNLHADGFDLLHPRVDWRGDSDGSVECEFPLYPACVAIGLAWFGDVDWPGQWLSLLAAVAATLAVHRLLELRVAAVPALLGALCFLGSRLTTQLSVRVMPDATSFALVAIGLLAFVHWLRSGRATPLVVATLATTLGALAKPTSLQIGLVQFLLAVVVAPRRLRSPWPWLGWGIVLAAVAAWSWHGVQLYRQTGLSFGVFVGDTKFPGLEHLMRPGLWLGLAQTTLAYGIGPIGAVAWLALLLRRRVDRVDLAFAVPVAIALVATMRYSVSATTGAHYHVFAAFVGAYGLARVWPATSTPLRLAGIAVVLLAHAAVNVAHERREQQDFARADLLSLAAATAAVTAPDELLIVRGGKERTDPFWRRRNNFEEPVLLFHARRRGFVVPVDEFTPETIAALRARGGRVVVDGAPQPVPESTSSWLAAHAELVHAGVGGRIHRLR